MTILITAAKETLSEQDELNPVLQWAIRERALAFPLGITRCVPQEKFPRNRSRNHIINLLLTKLVRSLWVVIGFRLS